MFATFKQIFRSSNKDLRARILFTLGVLFIFALGNSITIPGMNVITGDIGFLELFNAMSGGGGGASQPMWRDEDGGMHVSRGDAERANERIAERKRGND